MQARLTEADVTPEAVYRKRRQFLRQMGMTMLGTLGGSLLSGCSEADEPEAARSGAQWLRQRLQQYQPAAPVDDALTPLQDVVRYNNFYEFGSDKSDPARNSQSFQTDPWRIEVTGEVAKPGSYDLEALLRALPLQERIYRLRCVEAWSMVIPWIGVPLAALIDRLQPTGMARFVEFTTLHDPDQMIGQRSLFSTIDWPYREGLRLDEAMHPLTLLAVGLYGQPLPNQNGAPVRLVVPWKYGFKSIKSIVAMRFTRQQPITTWSQLAPDEYGFYANVNPAVDHPRWSQKYERRLPGSLWSSNRIPTEPFNGYAEEVAGLYRGMDLERYF